MNRKQAVLMGLTFPGVDAEKAKFSGKIPGLVIYNIFEI